MTEKAAKLLLDTTYLLPLLGLQVPQLKDYEKIFPKLLTKFETFFSPLSLVESKWVLLRLLKDRELEYKRAALRRFRLGVKTIVKSEKLNQTILTSYEIEKYADLLLDLVKDYFDRMIVSTAKAYNATLLTEDITLKKILKRVDELTELKILTWNQVISTL
ncbi:MAG: PIN domain-containing protein [Candidatus Baldrarchaeota archaeon]